jgi:hypothetical protein
MCLITFLPENIQPNIEAIENGTKVNKDGHGFAIVDGDRLIVRRSLAPEFLIDEFVRLRKEHPDGPAVFHSRLATHGLSNKDNCHPYRIGRDNNTVLFHNGIFPLQYYHQHDYRSDTRIVVDNILPQFRLTSNRGRRQFETWMGKFNRVVILTVDPHYMKTSYILNEREGFWDDGIWYSNTDYLGKIWKLYTIQGNDDCVYDERLICPSCFSRGTLLPYSMICTFCRMCANCDEYATECSCVYGKIAL